MSGMKGTKKVRSCERYGEEDLLGTWSYLVSSAFYFIRKAKGECG